MKIKYVFFGTCLAALSLFLSAPLSEASILLTSRKFTALGGTAITSTGVAGTVLSNGNVGLSPGATSGITGFPPAVIRSGAIIATGATTRQARMDLIKARVGLAGMPSDKNLSNVNLGGKTLRPGVYTFNGAANLTGALVLDARGHDDAFWVFQIATSLVTSVNSSVTLINPGPHGGADCGIFWNAGSAITIGANNRILGNYLAGTSVTFGGKSRGSARGLALAAVTLDNNQINTKGGPRESDWTGGLKYNASGKVVPNPSLAFHYFGNRYRTTHNATTYVSGKANVTAKDIRWRVRNGSWRSTSVGYGGKWKLAVPARLLRYGSNEIQMFARDSHGHRTPVRKMYIQRLR